MAVSVYILQDNLAKAQAKNLDAAKALYETNRSAIMTKLRPLCGNDVTAVNSIIESPETDIEAKVGEEIKLLSGVDAVVHVTGQFEKINSIIASAAGTLGVNTIRINNISL